MERESGSINKPRANILPVTRRYRIAGYYPYQQDFFSWQRAYDDNYIIKLAGTHESASSF